ncbi:MAG: LPFR motif small protein [Solirubrobacteraceae bacterium]
MFAAVINVITMVLGLILDIVTLPFRIILSLLGGAEFEFRRFSRPREV